MTDEAMTLKNRKRKLWVRYMRTQDPRIYDRFVRARNDLRRLTRNLKGLYEEQQQLLDDEEDEVNPRYFGDTLPMLCPFIPVLLLPPCGFDSPWR